MEKLELKHLVGYLPYGLNIEFERCIYPRRKEKEVLNPKHLELSFYGIKNNFKIKPILRPLSDLTKEIEVNGEKFVTIERLLDIETKHNWSNSDYLESESGQNEWWVKLKGGKPSYIFGYSSIMGFYCLNRFSEKQFIRNQIELYEKLYEWHFDIHGLIGKGLAIDINTL